MPLELTKLVGQTHSLFLLSAARFTGFLCKLVMFLHWFICLMVHFSVNGII